ncbi:MAG: hypothetical protein AAF399_03190, partial [Bacteroidota bacterium]
MQRLFRSFLLGFFLFFCASSLFAQYYGSPAPGVNGSWAVGVHLMGSQVQGDVDPAGLGVGAGIFGQKNISRHLDLKIAFFAGQNQGLDLEPSTGFRLNPAPTPKPAGSTSPWT